MAESEEKALHHYSAGNGTDQADYTSRDDDLSTLQLDPVKHYYKLGGKYIPGVTTIMRPMYAATYGAIDPAVMQAAADRGRAVHEAIHLYYETGQVDIKEELQGYMDAFLAWVINYRHVAIAAETKIANRALWYAGTADLVCLHGDDLILIDFKTTATPVEYLSRVQMSAYARAYKGKLAGTMEVNLKPNGEFKTFPFPIPDTEAWDVFLALLKVQNYINKAKWS